MKIVPRHWTRRVTFNDPTVKAVPMRDRIKYWNIVPGDKVCVFGDKTNTIHEVMSVNKITNQVFMKDATTGPGGATDSRAKSLSVNYNRCRLYLGEHEFPSKENPTVMEHRPVCASRLRTGAHSWRGGICTWPRYAVTTIPALPTGKLQEPRRIPWPRYVAPKAPNPTEYETEPDIISEITYTPPPVRVGKNITSMPLAPAPEKEYIRRLWAGQTQHDSTLLMEMHMTEELASEHSRAKRQKRWKARKVAEKALLMDLIRHERKFGRHKSKKGAEVVALQKWKVQLHEEKKAEKKRRLIQSGVVAQRDGRRAKKVKKAAKRLEALRTLVLKEGPNQVLPLSA